MGQTMNLQELQKKMESQQATLAELLKHLKPTVGSGAPHGAGGNGAIGSISADGALGNGSAANLQQESYGHGFPEPSLSVIKGWDTSRDTQSGSQNSNRRRRAAHQQRGGTSRSDGKQSLTRRERYLGVQSYWSSMKREDRKKILTAPVSRIVDVAAATGGPEAVQTVMEGLKLLKKNESRHACFWQCPSCDMKTADPRAFMDHMAAYHEEVQYACEDTPLLCTQCGQEVVGAYFHSGNAEDPSTVRCLRCSWDGGHCTPGDMEKLPPDWSLFVPRTPASMVNRQWSDALNSCSSQASDAESYDSSSSSNKDVNEEANPSEGSSDFESSSGSYDIRSGLSEDELLLALAERVDDWAGSNRNDFEAALAIVVQRAQRLMHGPPPADELPNGVNTLEEARSQAISRLRNDEKYPDQVEQFRVCVPLLDTSELQDLLSIMAKKYSPPPNQHAVPRSYEVAPYQPVIVSLFGLEDQVSKNCEEQAKTRMNKSTNDASGLDHNSLLSPGASAHPDNINVPPGVGLENLECVSEKAVLKPHAWWIDHLMEKTQHIAVGSDGGEDTILLQWIFGAIAHGATDEFLERQRMAIGSNSPQIAIMEAYSEIAETWRHLAATMDRKRHISTLRDAVAEDYDAVNQFDPELTCSLQKQAAEFYSEVASDNVLMGTWKEDIESRIMEEQKGENAIEETKSLSKHERNSAWSQVALAKLQRFHQLKDETSIRYAQALIDREIAVLELAEVMDQHECDIAERELQNVDAALDAAKQDLADAEAELARIQAEGPASHRRKDLLDRVNKEAEHRERVSELQTHIAACQERIASEEAFGNSALQRREEAAKNLSEGRSELQWYLERRQALDKACHAVLAAQERDAGQELTDAYVDARIKAVWQVVAGVADAIRRLHDRYTAIENSKESARHERCTRLAKSLSADLDERIRMWWDDLDKLRRRAADLACVDAGQFVEALALEVIRQELETEAALAREAATADLLRELELEEEEARKAGSKKAKKKKKAKSSAGAAQGSINNENQSPDSSKKKSAQGDIVENSNRNQESKGGVENSKQNQAETTLIDEDTEYEAMLERRRIELLQQENERKRKEEELLRLVQEASLREAKNSKEVEQSDVSKQEDRDTTEGIWKNVRGRSASTASGRSSSAPRSPDGTGARIVLVHRNSAADANSYGAMPPPPPPPPPPPRPSSEMNPNSSRGVSLERTPLQEMRIVTYYGDWLCQCGCSNRLWDTCQCGQIPPCRDWVRGRCTYGNRCRFAHPPFELPDNLPRPKSPIAKPGKDAVVYMASGSRDYGGINSEEEDFYSSDGESIPPPPPPPPPQKSSTLPVKTPEAAPSVAPGSTAPVRQVGNPSGGGQTSVVAPPPLKPAPWAGIRPGTAVTQPAAPPLSLSTASQSPSGTKTSGVFNSGHDEGDQPRPPPPPPPRNSTQPSDMLLPNEQEEMSEATTSARIEPSGFELFGSNPLANPLQTSHVIDSNIILEPSIYKEGQTEARGSEAYPSETSSLSDKHHVDQLRAPGMLNQSTAASPHGVGVSLGSLNIGNSMNSSTSLLSPLAVSSNATTGNLFDASSPAGIISSTLQNGFQVGSLPSMPQQVDRGFEEAHMMNAREVNSDVQHIGQNSTIVGSISGLYNSHFTQYSSNSGIPLNSRFPSNDAGLRSGLGLDLGPTFAGLAQSSSGHPNALDSTGQAPSHVLAGGNELFDEWDDLQLQLPSDLGAMLGTEAPMDQVPQFQPHHGTNFGPDGSYRMWPGTE